MKTAPVALFVYNRPEHARQTLEALAKNALAAETDLYIFSDGPKNPEAEEKVSEVRKIIDGAAGFRSVRVRKEERNLGLADSIAGGLSRLAAEHDRFIVLEDDIVTSPLFLEYMNQALATYESDEDVMHVSGYFFPVAQDGLPDTFFYNQASCWGWGTWARAWRHFSPDTEALLEAIKHSGRKIRREHEKNMASQLKANLRGDIKTWAAKWDAAVFLRNGFCLHPKASLAKNIGIDGSGEHGTEYAGENEGYDEKPLSVERIPKEESELAARRADEFLKSIKPSILKRLRWRISRLFK